ncbi:MAG: hypothetical protein VST67_01835 [Nitrospirota bacterium]|nr:hypothetical protein [Nitrospirota bacterium]
MMKKSFVIFGIIEAIPLPIFLIYAGLIDQSIPQNWQGPYLTSSIAALLTTTLLILNKVPLNRLIIGINVYLITGSFILVTEQVWLNQLYGKMEAAGMLAVIIIVGVVSLLLSPAGFIGIKSQDRKKVIIFSLYLLVVAQVAFLFSFYFQGNKIYSEYVPFMALFAIQAILKSKMIVGGKHMS